VSELAETGKAKVSELAGPSIAKVSELAETSKAKVGELTERFTGSSEKILTPEEKVKSMVVISLLGPPGIGKGALSRHLSPDFDIVHVSTGDLIRQEIAQKTPIGLRVQAQVARGKLLPDEVVAQLIEKKFKELAESSESHQGILLDGFPRQLSQAQLLESGRFNIPPLAAVISITMPDEMLDIRRSGRRICPKCAATYNLHEVDQGPYHLRPRLPEKEGKCDNDGAELISRPDDEPTIASMRMREFHDFTPPMIEFYRKKGILIEVEKQRQMKHIYKEIKPELERLVLTSQKSQGLPAAAFARAVDAFEYSKEKAGQASALVQEKAGPAFEMAKEKAGPALEMAKEKAVQAAGFVKDKAGAGMALAKEKVVTLTDRTVDTASKMKDTKDTMGGEKIQLKDPFKDIPPVKDVSPAAKHERFGINAGINAAPEVRQARG